MLAQSGVAFDKLFTSVQTRAIRTGNLALEEAGLLWLPVEKSWRLNERHYGALTGLNKAETAALHGEEQVKIWRRSYDTPPPPLDAASEFDFSKDRRYAGVAICRRTESLKTTLERVLPYWNGSHRARSARRQESHHRRARQFAARDRQASVRRAGR